MLEKVRSTLIKNGVDIHSTPLLVALSGGADSVSLLLALKEIGVKNLSAAHVNHGIRGGEADRDESFCRELCARENVPFFSTRINVPEIAKEKKLSLETAARNARYEFLTATAEKLSAVTLTAHTANDNLETLLFYLGRGTSLKGMGGIEERRKLSKKSELELLRPLLCVTRNEIEEYLKERNQTYCTDATNFDVDITRNALRHNVCKSFLEIFPDGLSSVTRLTQLLREDGDFIGKETERVIEEYREKGISVFDDLHVSLFSRAVKAICEEICEKSLEKVHVDAVMKMIKDRRGECDLPNSVTVLIENNYISVKGEKKEYESIPFKIGEYPLWEDWFALVTEEYTQIYLGVNKTITYKAENCDILQGQKAVFRTRRAGDEVFLPKRRVTKTLKKLFNEEKTDRKKRDTLPVLAVENRVILLPIDEFKSGGK